MVDSDGRLLRCHGCTYQTEDIKEKFSYGNIFETDFDELIGNLMGKTIEIIPQKCKNCDLEYCVYCPLQHNKDVSGKLPNIILDKPCSDIEYKLYKTISEIVKEYKLKN